MSFLYVYAHLYVYVHGHGRSYACGIGRLCCVRCGARAGGVVGCLARCIVALLSGGRRLGYALLVRARAVGVTRVPSGYALRQPPASLCACVCVCVCYQYE